MNNGIATIPPPGTRSPEQIRGRHRRPPPGARLERQQPPRPRQRDHRLAGPGAQAPHRIDRRRRGCRAARRRRRLPLPPPLAQRQPPSGAAPSLRHDGAHRGLLAPDRQDRAGHGRDPGRPLPRLPGALGDRAAADRACSSRWRSLRRSTGSTSRRVPRALAILLVYLSIGPRHLRHRAAARAAGGQRRREPLRGPARLHRRPAQQRPVPQVRRPLRHHREAPGPGRRAAEQARRRGQHPAGRHRRRLFELRPAVRDPRHRLLLLNGGAEDARVQLRADAEGARRGCARSPRTSPRRSRATCSATS